MLNVISVHSPNAGTFAIIRCMCKQCKSGAFSLSPLLHIETRLHVTIVTDKYIILTCIRQLAVPFIRPVYMLDETSYWLKHILHCGTWHLMWSHYNVLKCSFFLFQLPKITSVETVMKMQLLILEPRNNSQVTEVTFNLTSRCCQNSLYKLLPQFKRSPYLVHHSRVAERYSSN